MSDTFEVALLFGSKKIEQEVVMLAIRLPAEIECRLEKLSAATGRTKSFYVREAIVEHLGDLEDIYLAEQRLADLRAGKTIAILLDDIMKANGISD